MIVDRNVCMFCGACVGTCNFEAITLWETRVEFDDDKCTSCLTCIRTCPVGAISED